MTAVPQDATAQPQWFLDNLAYVRIDGDQTRGAFSLVELAGRRGHMPPVHIDHPNDETIYVVAGRLTLFAGDREIALDEGDAAVAPRGVPHSYRIESEQARWLVISSPAGFERFLLAASEPAPADELPPPGRHIDLDALVQLAAEHQIEAVESLETAPAGS